ncbi:disulfide oxidoreductase YuzD [Thermolongibacillus altinsuensis]|uniref:Disulfide oxidoreductase YuzD n=2 Tax=Thermolongibacillus altinsuensis TaxID=575256 RepID=A0A4R1QLP6_9BACL|nr:disulfide oxidoreductase YuzD [Thermolongibacillus altinsuensis]
MKTIEICVYGAETVCASCVQLPSAKETYEWLEAAISRKYPNQSFRISYIDIFNPPEEEEKKRFAQKVIDEDLFYPVVVIEGKIVGEGNPKLKTIYEEMEKYGYKS